MASPPRGDGRRTRCPLCLHIVSTGTLRVHVASVRCFASAVRDKVEFTSEQRALIAQVQALDAKIKDMVKAAKEAERVGA